MRLTYKYKIYTSKRNPKADELFGIACWIYNHCIALHKRYYRLYGKSLNKYQLQKHLTKLKKQVQFVAWNKLSSQSIQQITEKIDDGYKRFFKRQALRPPSFRGKRKYKSVTFKNTGWSVNGNEFVINSIKLRLRFFKSREFDGEIKNVTLKRDATGDLWLCFSMDNVKKNHERKPMTGKTAGFDFGLKTFLTSSDGYNIESPRFLMENIGKLRRESRQLSRKQKGSSGKRKARIELARIHRRIEWQREDFQWKLAGKLIERYDVLCFEDLNMKAIQRLWGRKICDLAFSSFMNKVESLAEKHGKKVVKIDRFYASSKICSGCGHKYDGLKIGERSWTCPECGRQHDRDFNAAKNILKVGASTLNGGVIRPATAG